MKWNGAALYDAVQIQLNCCLHLKICNLQLFLKASVISFSIKCDNEIGEENNMMLERKTRVQYKKEDEG